MSHSHSITFSLRLLIISVRRQLHVCKCYWDRGQLPYWNLHETFANVFDRSSRYTPGVLDEKVDRHD